MAAPTGCSRRFSTARSCSQAGRFRLVSHFAGLVVRNSIILVDFIELRWKEGMPLDQAVTDAGAVRFRPMAGEIASLARSRMTVPVVYFGDDAILAAIRRPQPRSGLWPMASVRAQGRAAP